MQNPYRVLAVPPHATSHDIRRAYRSLARRYHPDVGEPTSERFAEIRAAYELLNNPDTRDQYDRSREGYAERRHQQQFSGAGATPVGYSARRHEREFAPPLSILPTERDELFRGAIETLDLLDRGWVHEGLTHHRDEPLRYELQLSPREAANGGHFRFSVPVRTRCDTCGLLTRLDCQVCGGDGYIVEERELDIAVPAGVRDGASCTMPLEPLGVEGRTIEVTVRIR
jgi:molecular chaperone DnaJ